MPFPELSLVNVDVSEVEHRGRRAMRMVERGSPERAMAILVGSDFQDGVIEALVAGAPLPGAIPQARGFVGISFRVSEEGARGETFFLRPTNGRAPDQLRRNHATQYQSSPDFPWHRLRSEAPGQYESYVDLEPGVWTQLRIVVSGTRAELFVHDAAQPCLVVNDLKLGVARGAVALWIGSGTEAFFADVLVWAAES